MLDHPGLSQAEWDAIVKSQGGRCNSCGAKARLTIDHIEPVTSPLGVHAAYNIQGLCFSCNSRKGAKLIPGTQLGLPLKRANKKERNCAVSKSVPQSL
jgi:5-methylcytosine-specific restriction endonuclease McrA